jgi:hypothetical protein
MRFLTAAVHAQSSALSYPHHEHAGNQDDYEDRKETTYQNLRDIDVDFAPVAKRDRIPFRVFQISRISQNDTDGVVLSTASRGGTRRQYKRVGP